MSTFLSGFLAAVGVWAMGFVVWRSCNTREERRIPPSFESASLEQCAQSEQVCNAVAQRLGVTITLPPWQAMVLTPILDPR